MTKDDKRFWFGAVLCLTGVAMLFVSMFLPPRGEISDMALWAAGEIFTLSGGLMGLDAYFDFKIKKYIKHSENEEGEEK